MLPLATTTVTVVEQATSGDPYETATSTTVATGVRAVIGSPTGVDARVGGDQEVVEAAGELDGTYATRTCRLVDEHTGDVWQVVWVRNRVGLGLDHQRVGLVAVQGGASG